MKDYQDNIIETHKGKLVSKIVKMSMDIEVPESPREMKMELSLIQILALNTIESITGIMLI